MGLGVNLNGAGSSAITKHHGAAAFGDFNAFNVAQGNRSDELGHHVDIVQTAAIDGDNEVLKAIVAVAAHANLWGVAVAVAGRDLQRGLLSQIIKQRIDARAFNIAAGVHLRGVGRILVTHVYAGGRHGHRGVESFLGVGTVREHGQSGAHSQ